jgi:hypothetical protein
MKKVGMRRGVRALVLLASIVGVITVGIATQAVAGLSSPSAPALIGIGVAQNSTNKSVTADIDVPADGGSIIVVSVATGTHTGTPLPDVACTDNTSDPLPSTNIYAVAADRNTGNGRLFVTVSKLNKGYNTVADPTVTCTYPQFSGASVIRAVAFTNSTVVPAVASNTGFGSNPTVNSGTICVSGRHFLFGVVANGNVSTFTADSPGLPIGAPPSSNSVGSGAGKRTLTTAYQFVDPYGAPCTPEALTGTPPTGGLSGSGFWQAAIVGLAHPT